MNWLLRPCLIDMKPEFQQMIDDCNNELDDIQTRISALSPTDKEMKYLTDYALIRTCGTAEIVYKSIIADYFKIYSSSQLDKYLESTIRDASHSALYENMCKLLDKFDDSWCKNFKNAVAAHADLLGNNDKEKLILSAKSLVNNRHAFAHGKSMSASFAQIREYFSDVVELIKILDAVII